MGDGVPCYGALEIVGLLLLLLVPLAMVAQSGKCLRGKRRSSMVYLQGKSCASGVRLSRHDKVLYKCSAFTFFYLLLYYVLGCISNRHTHGYNMYCINLNIILHLQIM